VQVLWLLARLFRCSEATVAIFSTSHPVGRCAMREKIRSQHLARKAVLYVLIVPGRAQPGESEAAVRDAGAVMRSGLD
jgi:hypothetical protein